MVNRHGIEDKAEFIKNTRMVIGMSQPQFAQSMGVTIQSVSYWENKKRDPNPLVIEWCLGVRQCWKYAQKIGVERQGHTILMACGLGGLVSMLVDGVEQYSGLLD